jgi:hypothetical protein
MKYTVVWRPYAERSLTELWTQSNDRQSITNAANTIDALLRTDPSSIGESREKNVRLLYVTPLAVYVDVFPEDRRVAVWPVWQYPRRKR